MARDTEDEVVHYLLQLADWVNQSMYDKCDKLLTEADIDDMSFAELGGVVCILHCVKSKLRAWPAFFERASRRLASCDIEAQIMKIEQFQVHGKNTRFAVMQTIRTLLILEQLRPYSML
jgi:hypothetical protein